MSSSTVSQSFLGFLKTIRPLVIVLSTLLLIQISFLYFMDINLLGDLLTSLESFL